MNRFVCAGLALLLVIGQAAAADSSYEEEWYDEATGAEEFSEVDYYNQLQEQPVVIAEQPTEYVEPPTVYYEEPTDDGEYEIVQLEDDLEEPEPIVYPDDAESVVLEDEPEAVIVEDDDEEVVEVVEEEYEPDADEEEIIVETEEPMEVIRSEPYVMDDYPGETPVHSFTATGQYIHSSNKRAKVKFGSRRDEMARGHANGSAYSLVYNRQVNDYFKVGIMYQYAFMNLTTGTPVARNSNLYNKESSRWHSHAFGVLPEFDLGEYGRFKFSVIQSFDRARGYEQIGAARMDIKDYDRDVTSLDAWYEKDFKAGCNWKFTPYVGWRSQYIEFDKKNNFATMTRYNDYEWVHLGAAGFKIGYQKGAFGVKLRGGVSHRFSKNDVHGYGTRAVAPGTYQYSHNANLDRTVGTAGASINYNFNQRAGIEVGYDGYMGKDTRAHTGSLSFTFSF